MRKWIKVLFNIVGPLCLMYAACSACKAPKSDDEINRENCTAACLPNPMGAIHLTIGKITCTCIVQTDGGIVRASDGGHYGRLCGGRAIRSVSNTAFNEDVECAP